MHSVIQFDPDTGVTTIADAFETDWGKWGYIDKTGSYVVKPSFENALGFSEDLAAVRADGKWGYIDLAGRLIIPHRLDKAEPFRKGLAFVREADRDGYTDSKGVYVWRSPPEGPE